MSKRKVLVTGGAGFIGSQAVTDSSLRTQPRKEEGRAGVPETVAAHARNIISGVEDRSCDPDKVLLDDADALSFLSLSSDRYADHFGLAQTRRKVLFTVGRLGPRARAKLALVRIRPDVERLLRDSAA